MRGKQRYSGKNAAKLTKNADFPYAEAALSTQKLQKAYKTLEIMETSPNFLCEVIQTSSPSTFPSASSLLAPLEDPQYRQTAWESEEGFPQTLVFRLVRGRPGVVKCFGWSCCKAVKTNPASVAVAASVDGKVYEELGMLQGRELAAPQYFAIKPLYLRFGYLRMTIHKAFGSTKTAISKVFLLEDVPMVRSSPDTDLNTLLFQLPRSNSQQYPPPSTPIPLPSHTHQFSSLRDTLKDLSAQVKALQAEISPKDSSSLPSAAGVRQFLRNWQETVLEPRLQRFESRMLELLLPRQGPHHRGGNDRYRDAASALY